MKGDVPLFRCIPWIASFAIASFAFASQPWAERSTEVEQILAKGEVTSIKPLGEGRNDPKKLTLSLDGSTLSGLWKPIERGKKEWAWESYQAEVAAYELDKLLDLRMVPPTVVRTVDGVPGSLQLWVDGCRLFADVRDETPAEPERWERQISRMKVFDNLISNWDRSDRDYLVDSGWGIVLIDHSQAFLSTNELSPNPDQIPERFDKRLVEEIRALEPDALRFKFGRLLMERQVDAILARRDVLLDRLEKLIAERGESAVVF
ncbi:MAG TPA: hypothetical protein VLK65_14305 [Vicinamibacteria bacterium]|nr:hypothetical protein [Vicinamibacteria bacterium]